MQHRPLRAALAVAATLFAGSALAQVPPEIATQLKTIGRTIDIRVGQIYAPLVPHAPYAGITATRDVAYGGDPLQKLDVFNAEGTTAARRPVLIFVHGGGFVRGDKAPAGSPFNDNVMVWAVKHGMVGVNINYRLAPKDPWPAGAQDLASAIAWVKANIKAYGGDPDAVFLWGHSAGANHVADYVANDQFHPGGAGVAGAVLMSGIYDPMPAPNPYYGNDPAQLSARASRPGLLKTRVPLMLINAEWDPEVMLASGKSLNEALCAQGHCPVYLFAKDADHLSEGMAIGSSDVSVSDPILAFIQKN